MFAGHLAVALGAKKAAPRIPLAALVAAAFGLDLLWPVFLLVGLETVRIHPGDTAFTNLAFDSYPWSHSLAAALGWSGLSALIGRRLVGSWRAGAIIGALVLSHWILDFVTHRPDLPLWPGGPQLGLGLWNSIPGTIILEGGLFTVGVWLYLRATSHGDAVGRWALIGLVGLVGIIWVTQPWSPPPRTSGAVAWGALILWLLPFWAGWIERHRVPVGPA